MANQSEWYKEWSRLRGIADDAMIASSRAKQSGDWAKSEELEKKALQFNELSERLNPENSKRPYTLFANGNQICELDAVRTDGDSVFLPAPFPQSPGGVCELRQNSDHTTIKIMFERWQLQGGAVVWQAKMLGS